MSGELRPAEVVELLDADATVEAEGDDYTDERPDDCDCTPPMEDLPCWPSYRDGFKKPAEVSDQ